MSISIIRLCATLVLVHLLAPSVRAQIVIGGVVNTYARVSAINRTCEQSIDLDRPLAVQEGARLLLVQMEGSAVDDSDGSIADAGLAGQFELVTVTAVRGQRLVLNAPVRRGFRTDRILQAVTVPVYDSAVVRSPLTCQPWNGSTGGILAVIVRGGMRLEAPVTVDGMGFSGGRVSLNGVGACGNQATFVDYRQRSAGEKGSGIFPLDPARNAARAPWGNGGGGGTTHNGGGGGGANGGAGGVGGYQWEGCGTQRTSQGQGGFALSDPASGVLLLPGGGGGGAHQNDGEGSAGGNGGGAIYIRAGRFEGNGYVVSALGATALPCRNDGGGGGGAGGSIVLDVGSVRGPYTLDVRGGDGGQVAVSGLHGPGGGGGGGRIAYAQQRFVPSGIVHRLDGGRTGGNRTRPSSSGRHGATDGAPGALIYNAVVLPDALPAKPLVVRLPNDTTLCLRQNLAIDAIVEGGSGAPTVVWSSLQGPIPAPGVRTLQVGVNQDTTIIVTVTDTLGCSASDTMRISVDVRTTVVVDTLRLGTLSCVNAVDTAVVIRNVGADPLTIRGVVVADSVFRLPAIPSVVPAGDSVVVPVSIRVGQTGSYTALLTLQTDACVGDVTALVQWDVLRPSWRVPDTIALPLVVACGDTVQESVVEVFDAAVPSIVALDTTWAQAPFSVVRHTNRSVVIRWQPTADGVVMAELTAVVQPCMDTVTIVIRGERRSVAVAVPSRIVLPEEPEQAVFRVENTGTAPITLRTARTTRPGYAINLALPTTIQPGAGVEVQVLASADPADDSTDIVLETDGPCGTVMVVRVVRSLFVETTVAIPTVESSTGLVVELPIVIKDVRTNIRGRIEQWECEVAFDNSALAPWPSDSSWTRGPGVESMRIADPDRSVWKLRGRWIGGDTLAVLKCLVLLDTATVIPVRFSLRNPFDWEGAGATVVRRIRQEDGAVVLVEQICTKPRRLIVWGNQPIAVMAVDVLGRIVGTTMVTGMTDDAVIAEAARRFAHVRPFGIVILGHDGEIIRTELMR
ncbi:MAG: hypothetical protein MUC47_01395 [Candidatus Kapabacteria bacterium]|nr:hypothetical protein [Candidatus Kapabacteria bacterium]